MNLDSAIHLKYLLPYFISNLSIYSSLAEGGSSDEEDDDDDDTTNANAAIGATPTEKPVPEQTLAVQTSNKQPVPLVDYILHVVCILYLITRT